MKKQVLFMVGIVSVFAGVACSSSKSANEAKKYLPTLETGKGKGGAPAPGPVPKPVGDAKPSGEGSGGGTTGTGTGDTEPSQTPVVRTRADGSVRVSVTGAEFKRDYSIGGLSKSYRDPSGLVWGAIIDPDDGQAATAYDQREAKKKCESAGARLPRDEEFEILKGYLGVGSAQGYSQLSDDGVTPVIEGTFDRDVYSASNTRSYANYFKFASGKIDHGSSTYRGTLCVSGGDIEKIYNGTRALRELISFKGTSCKTGKYQGEWTVKAAVCRSHNDTDAIGYVPQQITMSVLSASHEELQKQPDLKSIIMIPRLQFQRTGKEPTQSGNATERLTLKSDKEYGGCGLTYYYEADIMNWSKASGTYSLGKIGYNEKSDELLLEVYTGEWVHFCRGIEPGDVSQQILFKRVGTPESSSQGDKPNRTEGSGADELRPRPRPKR